MKPRAGQKCWAATLTHKGSQQCQKKMKKTTVDEDSEDTTGHDNSGEEGREGSVQEGEGDNEGAEKDARPDEGEKDGAKTDEECEQAATNDDGAEKDAPLTSRAKKMPRATSRPGDRPCAVRSAQNPRLLPLARQPLALTPSPFLGKPLSLPPIFFSHSFDF